MGWQHKLRISALESASKSADAMINKLMMLARRAAVPLIEINHEPRSPLMA